MSKASKRDEIDRLMRKAMKAGTSREANAIVDDLGKYGDDAVYALEAIVDQTRFERVRAHGLQVIRDAKSEDAKY